MLVLFPAPRPLQRRGATYLPPVYHVYITPRAIVSWVFFLLESNVSLSDQSCLYSGLTIMPVLPTLYSGVNVISLSFCSVPVLRPSLSSKYSALMVPLTGSLKSYLTYPAIPYHF